MSRYPPLAITCEIVNLPPPGIEVQKLRLDHAMLTETEKELTVAIAALTKACGEAQERRRLCADRKKAIESLLAAYNGELQNPDLADQPIPF